MAAIDSLCVLVEIGIENSLTIPNAQFHFVKRVIRSYESRHRAEEDLELLCAVAPGTYRIDDITHIER